MIKPRFFLTAFLAVSSLFAACSSKSGDPVAGSRLDTWIAAGAIGTPTITATPIPEPSETAKPSATNTLTPTETPTLTPTFMPSPTVAVSILNGKLFLDKNASGLHEPGEEGLADFEVCVVVPKKGCVFSDSEGNYSIQIEGKAIGENVYIRIADPNAGNPAKEMRYFNFWVGEVSIPSYEVEGTVVPEQVLNDTSVNPIDELIEIKIGTENEIGLMQGILTLPFLESEQPTPRIWDYFDVYHHQVIDPDHPWRRDGVRLNYDGRYNYEGGGENIYNPSVGVGDAHTGLDYSVPEGTTIVHAGPTGEVHFIIHNPENGEIMVWIRYEDYDTHSNTYYLSTYSHQSQSLVLRVGDAVYRGQIIGLSGNTGRQLYMYFQLHFDIVVYHEENDSYHYQDPYRATIDCSGFPPDKNACNLDGHWTVDNDPQHSR